MLDRLFDDVMTGAIGASVSPSSARTFSPAVDLRANEEEIVVSADLPGVEEKDVEISVEAGVLTIKGKRNYEGNSKDKVWLGRNYGSFARSFTLPDTVDPERISAELANGVLTVRIAQQPRLKPRKITISPRQASPQLPQDKPGDETR
jgi:HSP20 family protein